MYPCATGYIYIYIIYITDYSLLNFNFPMTKQWWLLNKNMNSNPTLICYNLILVFLEEDKKNKVKTLYNNSLFKELKQFNSYKKNVFN
jgi:hypothetical protein